jgi:hypothetical protein
VDALQAAGAQLVVPDFARLVWREVASLG